MKVNKKSIILLSVLLILTLAITGCGKKNEPESTNSGNQTEETAGEAIELTEAFAEQPVMLTSVGQSADVEMIKNLVTKAEIDYEMNKSITGAELNDEIKTLVLAVGGSSKGLGAAGINADDEIKRTEELINTAKEKDIKVIAMHVGGENRRGELSDKFINPSLENADYIIVVADGNKDDIFTNASIKNNIPLAEVNSIGEVLEPLQKAFK